MALKIYQSGLGATPNCVSGLAAANESFTRILNLSQAYCDACLQPLPPPSKLCCCNCWIVHWPGLTGSSCTWFDGMGSAKDIMLYGDLNTPCTIGTYFFGPPNSCSWSAKTIFDFDGNRYTSCGIGYHLGDIVGSMEFGVGVITNTGGITRSYGATYTVTEASCKAMHFTLKSGDSLTPCGGAWPTTVEVEGTSCPSSSSLSSSSSALSSSSSFFSSSSYSSSSSSSSSRGCTGNCTYVATNPQVTTSNFTTDGTYNPPDQGALTTKIFGAAGGGGAGGDSGASPGGDGAGGGGYAESAPTAVLPANLYTHSIGTGGIGGISGNADEAGTDGTTTSLSGPGISITATGGIGGGGTVGTTKTRLGGTGSGGALNGTGTTGTAHSGAAGGAGGGAAGVGGGPGGGGGSSHSNGTNGSNPGGGGGGGGKRGDGGHGGNGQAIYVFTKWDWVLQTPTSCSAGCGCETVNSTFYTNHGRPTSGSDTLTISCK